MLSIEDTPVFAYRGERASINEVLAAAAARGDLRAAIERHVWVAACAAAAETEGLELDSAAIEEAVSAYRYEHDLISAEETEAWLAARGLDADDIANYFARQQCFQVLKGRVPAPEVAGIISEPDLLSELTSELFFSGGFGQFATALAYRLVAGSAANAPVGTDELRRERRNFLHRNAIEERDVPAWLKAFGRSPDWLDRMLGLEASFGAFASATITPASLAQALASVRMPFTRVELERVEFDTLDALREAELCVREDGMTLEQVAQESLFPFRRQTVFAGDLPATEREAFLFARLGDLLRLNSPSGEFQVGRVVLRVEPTLDDPEVRRRLGDKILAAALAEAGGSDLHWIISD